MRRKARKTRGRFRGPFDWATGRLVALLRPSGRLVTGLLVAGGLLHSGPILADDHGLYLELGAGYDRHQRDEAPQSVIRLRYEFQNRHWWAPDAVEVDHHSSIEKTSGEKLVDQASIIWRFRLF